MTDMTFCQMPLDRASAKRRDKTWLAKQEMDSRSQVLLYWRGRFWHKNREPFLISVTDCLAVKSNFNVTDLVFLGMNDEVPWFSLDVSHHEENALLNMDIGIEEAFDFRASVPFLTAPIASIMAYAKSLHHWHNQSKFCGKCGAKNVAGEGGHIKHCSSEACQNQSFPRTDPAVIMLITAKGDDGIERCLLGTHHRLKANVYSTLAGFVDPGESLEQAVARELYEEAGVHAQNIRYFGSQPWPFPGSIMLGFFASSQSMELHIDYDELSGAQWFSADELATFDEWGDEGENRQLPRKESIARQLINTWLEEQRCC